MVSVEMIYKLLDGIRQAQSDSRKTRIICRLYAMLYTSDTGNKLIKQTTQRIYELVSPPHWYQLIIWNNFFHGLFSLRDKKFKNVRNYITFKSINKKQQQVPNNPRHRTKASRAQFDEIFNTFDNGLDISVVSLICVDYLIERQFNIKINASRNYTLEENGNRQIEARMNERNYPLENKVIEVLRKQSDDIDDAFDRLCNVLSVLGRDCIRAVMINSDLVGELFSQEEIPFNAVFDLMNRLNIYDICMVDKNSSLPAIERKENEVKSDEKEAEAIRVGDHGGEGFVTNYLVSHFGDYVQSIYEKESKDRLYVLLTDYRQFIGGASGDVRKQFFSRISANPNLFFDPRFIAPVKHIFKQFNDDEMHEWYIQYWDQHGIKAVIDIIYQCEFKFETFCDLIKAFPKRLQDCRICKFEEWVELIVCRNIHDTTKLLVCKNPPIKFKDIVNMKDKEMKQDYLQKLKLVLVEDDVSKAQQVGFLPRDEMPLIKYRKRAICNQLLQHLMDDSIPDLTSKGGFYQDKKILVFCASVVGQEAMKFMHQIVEILKQSQDSDEITVECFFVVLFVCCCVMINVFVNMTQTGERIVGICCWQVSIVSWILD